MIDRRRLVGVDKSTAVHHHWPHNSPDVIGNGTRLIFSFTVEVVRRARTADPPRMSSADRFSSLHLVLPLPLLPIVTRRATMKFLYCLPAVVASAAAFAPASTSSASTALSMSDKPMLEIQEKVPCFGAAPFLGTEVFFGENYWDKLTLEYGSEDTGTFLRAAELKHGRSAMLATVGFAFQKLGITFDKISPHEYLSVTQNIKFADLAAMGPLEAIKNIPAEGWWQIFGVIAAIEIYELTHRDGEIKSGESVAPGLRPGGLTGDLGWNPLKIKVDDRRRLVELQVRVENPALVENFPLPLTTFTQNGRAAMFAISAWVAAEAVPGSVPLNLPW